MSGSLHEVQRSLDYFPQIEGASPNDLQGFLADITGKITSINIGSLNTETERDIYINSLRQLNIFRQSINMPEISILSPTTLQKSITDVLSHLQKRNNERFVTVGQKKELEKNYTNLVQGFMDLYPDSVNLNQKQLEQAMENNRELSFLFFSLQKLKIQIEQLPVTYLSQITDTIKNPLNRSQLEVGATALSGVYGAASWMLGGPFITYLLMLAGSALVGEGMKVGYDLAQSFRKSDHATGSSTEVFNAPNQGISQAISYLTIHQEELTKMTPAELTEKMDMLRVSNEAIYGRYHNEDIDIDVVRHDLIDNNLMELVSTSKGKLEKSLHSFNSSYNQILRQIENSTGIGQSASATFKIGDNHFGITIRRVDQNQTIVTIFDPKNNTAGLPAQLFQFSSIDNAARFMGFQSDIFGHVIENIESRNNKYQLNILKPKVFISHDSDIAKISSKKTFTEIPEFLSVKKDLDNGRMRVDTTHLLDIGYKQSVNDQVYITNLMSGYFKAYKDSTYPGVYALPAVPAGIPAFPVLPAAPASMPANKEEFLTWVKTGKLLDGLTNLNAQQTAYRNRVILQAAILSRLFSEEKVPTMIDQNFFHDFKDVNTPKFLHRKINQYQIAHNNDIWNNEYNPQRLQQLHEKYHKLSPRAKEVILNTRPGTNINVNTLRDGEKRAVQQIWHEVDHLANWIEQNPTDEQDFVGALRLLGAVKDPS